MARLFVILKRKGSKRYFGAIPVRKGSSPSKVKKAVRKKLKKGFVFRIITLKQLRRIVARQAPVRVRRKRRAKKRKKRKRR
jgi:hypothetical protein